MVRPAFYDDPEFDYESYWQSRKYEHLAEVTALKNFVKTIGKRKELSASIILEIGAGFGRLAKFYLPLVGKGVLLEPSKKLIAKGKESLKNFSNWNYYKGYAEEVDKLGRKFDLVLLIRVLHHLDDPKLVFKKIYSLLASDGFFILEIPNKFSFKLILINLLKGNLSYFNPTRIDRRSVFRRKKNIIPFYNYSPWQIEKELKIIGFRKVKKLSVSNFRSPFLKRLLPLKFLLFLEKFSQPILGFFNFGPSIFFLLARSQTKDCYYFGF